MNKKNELKNLSEIMPFVESKRVNFYLVEEGKETRKVFIKSSEYSSYLFLSIYPEYSGLGVSVKKNI